MAAQKLYNTPLDAEAMAARKQLFVSILGGYPIEVVERAFVRYCTEKDDVPAPANIKELAEKDIKLMKARKYLRRLNSLHCMATPRADGHKFYSEDEPEAVGE